MVRNFQCVNSENVRDVLQGAIIAVSTQADEFARYTLGTKNIISFI